MGGGVGGVTSKYYVETRGLKVSGGQFVKAGTVLTRQGDKWRAGINVTGRTSLTAKIDGEVYFTKKKGGYNQILTVVNIRSVASQTK